MENEHLPYALNVGISLANGDLIARLDSDDIWFPEKLEKQVLYLVEHPDCGACFTYAEYSYKMPRDIDIYTVDNRSRAEWLYHFFHYGNCLCHSSVVYRKSLIGSGYRLTLCQLQDFELWIRIAKQAEIHVFPRLFVANGGTKKT